MYYELVCLKTEENNKTAREEIRISLYQKVALTPVNLDKF